jgi:hypothetical protein
MSASIRLRWAACIIAVGIMIVFARLSPPLCVIPLIAAWGMIRQRAWSAYGLALFLFSESLPIIIFSVLTRRTAGLPIWTALALTILGSFFLFAGRSLAASGFSKGWALPWIALAVISVASQFFVMGLRPS